MPKELETLTDEEFLNESESESFNTLVDEPAEDELDDDKDDGKDDNKDDGVDETEDNKDVDNDKPKDKEKDKPGDDPDDTDDIDSEDTPDDTNQDDADDAPDGAGTDDSKDDADTGTKDQDADPDTKDANDLDYKAQYDELLAPFKANNKDMQVSSVEEARKLMQMGAGFHKRMGALKPHLKIIKALQNNNLLDPEKINYLIDLGNKKPDAIAKLLKESEIDPLDIDTDGDKNYEPTNHEVSDSEYNLDQAIEEIRSSSAYEKSIEIMGKQWDQKSRDFIGENPQVVKIVNAHIENGVFDRIQGFVDKRRALGELQGVSDVESYCGAADYLYKNGTIVDPNDKKSDRDALDKKKENDLLAAEAKKKKDAKRNKNRKAAAPAKGKPAKKHDTEDEYSSLSDDDFMKKYGA